MLVTAFPADLCLSFANTRLWRGTSKPTEELRDIADLLRWIEATAGLNREAIGPVREWLDTHPKRAARIFQSAIDLREAIYRTFSAVADNTPPPAADFSTLRDAIAESPERTRLETTGTAYAWRTPPLRAEHADLLAPVLWSAADLLLRAREHRIRRCANPECLWIFLDESRMGTRRWCDMNACGNRAKARRHYEKIRQA
ncbi:MAG TPA: ABATE domain-containing protein [Acetobacteraceae bacterium]|jgi:predicted RNA-binding Zn ribbon-like protein